FLNRNGLFLDLACCSLLCFKSPQKKFDLFAQHSNARTKGGVFIPNQFVVQALVVNLALCRYKLALQRQQSKLSRATLLQLLFGMPPRLRCFCYGEFQRFFPTRDFQFKGINPPNLIFSQITTNRYKTHYFLMVCFCGIPNL